MRGGGPTCGLLGVAPLVWLGGVLLLMAVLAGAAICSPVTASIRWRLQGRAFAVRVRWAAVFGLVQGSYRVLPAHRAPKGRRSRGRFRPPADLLPLVRRVRIRRLQMTVIVGLQDPARTAAAVGVLYAMLGGLTSALLALTAASPSQAPRLSVRMRHPGWHLGARGLCILQVPLGQLILVGLRSREARRTTVSGMLRLGGRG